jgi:AcrR family transcriptional regulator
MPARRKRKSTRNEPKQLRSRETVNVILEATIRVLDQEGSDAATTTRIAEVAGVSVGTLYQYFENRAAILDALQEQEFERATAFMQRVLEESGRSDERTLARAVIRGLLDLYERSPALHRVLVVEGLRVTPTDRVLAFDTRVVGLIRGFLATGGLAIRRPNLDAAAFVVYQSVRATMLARLLEHPPGLDDDALLEEMTDLVVRYLVEDSTRASFRLRAQAR